MPKTRSKKRTAEAPASVDVKAELSPPPSISAWGNKLLLALPANVSLEERALLRSQLDALESLPSAAASLPPDPAKPTIIKDRQALESLATSLAAANEVVVDLETSSLSPSEGVIVGIGLAVGNSTFYIPVNHCFEDSKALRPDQLTLVEVLGALRLQERPLINHNAKFDMRWLRHHGQIACRFIWDTMLAARLLHSDLPADLESVAIRELDVPKWDMAPGDKKRMQFLPIEKVAAYCAKDCWYTLSIYRRQLQCLV